MSWSTFKGLIRRSSLTPLAGGAAEAIDLSLVNLANSATDPVADSRLPTSLQAASANGPNGWVKLNGSGDLIGPIVPRTGTNSEINALVPIQGEIAVKTDTNQLVIGDGTTAGGRLIGPGVTKITFPGSGQTAQPTFDCLYILPISALNYIATIKAPANIGTRISVVVITTSPGTISSLSLADSSAAVQYYIGGVLKTALHYTVDVSKVATLELISVSTPADATKFLWAVLSVNGMTETA